MSFSVKFLLFLNRFFKGRPHPFNMRAQQKLAYYDYERESAPLVFKSFEKVLGEKFWIEKSVMDFGCGAGGKSHWLKLHGAANVIGLDTSKTLIEQAKERTKGEQGLEFIEGDITKPSFIENNSIDIVIANDVFEHVSNPQNMLKEAERILRPAGLLCINFEPYYHFLGHHMWDAIHIPWAHVFFAETTLIAAYKHLVQDLPDGQERIDFRISRNAQGQEYVGYLNHITLTQADKIFKESNFSLEHYVIEKFEKPILRNLATMTKLREFLTKKLIVVLRKKA
ncbi:MAG: class I SAM-dependent methyltransferase [Candidatus Abawacabacteria bacterium]|nr:class I SAM-dependent methyltransferase [Candidatus Abawacabacteria bacterium]